MLGDTHLNSFFLFLLKKKLENGVANRRNVFLAQMLSLILPANEDEVEAVFEAEVEIEAHP